MGVLSLCHRAGEGRGVEEWVEGTQRVPLDSDEGSEGRGIISAFLLETLE